MGKFHGECLLAFIDEFFTQPNIISINVMDRLPLLVSLFGIF